MGIPAPTADKTAKYNWPACSHDCSDDPAVLLITPSNTDPKKEFIETDGATLRAAAARPNLHAATLGAETYSSHRGARNDQPTLSHLYRRSLFVRWLGFAASVRVPRTVTRRLMGLKCGHAT